MKKLNISQEELLIQYNESLDRLLDECDWITYITGEMICGLVKSILIKNNIEHKLSSQELFVLYDKKYDILNLKEGEWQEKYGIPEIIEFIYEILEETND